MLRSEPSLNFLARGRSITVLRDLRARAVISSTVTESLKLIAVGLTEQHLSRVKRSGGVPEGGCPKAIKFSAIGLTTIPRDLRVCVVIAAERD